MEEKFNIKFIDNKGTFTLKNPDQFKRLYFPLMNSSGLVSSITPDLKGDIKTGQDSFLTIPVSVEDLYLTGSGRNFWARINNTHIWSATGMQSRSWKKNKDDVLLEAGLLYHKVTRINNRLKIRSDILNFVPSSGETCELMLVTLTNLSKNTMKIDPFFGMPLFCRSAENLRDHRNVTSMLNRTRLTKNGIIVTPTLLHNESGHSVNRTSYYTGGFTGKGRLPKGFFPTVTDYIGESGDFLHPEAVFQNRKPVKKFEQGTEAAAGIAFAPVDLLPGRSAEFIILLGITENTDEIQKWNNKFSTTAKCMKSLEETKKFWLDYSKRIQFTLSDKKFNSWIKWVSVQPLMRKIAGNSFLPDFDYGKGGRGWRDLWQDLLAIILVDPQDAKEMLLNNFAGIRIDGSNATIIGKKPGEFIGDRNNIARVWMDHGVWPFYTTALYIDQSGDLDILFSNVKYFRDFQIKRAAEKDWNWKEGQKNELRTSSGKIYMGSVLEHILIQNLIPFFNVGDHNNILLEGGDWNDGIDMAKDKGESVAFTSFYAGNLEGIASLLGRLKKDKKVKTIEVYEEMKVLLDTPH
ncbi:MAG: cellobiose phosphorylase, partial [Spirochaetes bacterium]|nr:cellobiose phosphorylase [Spirochaetota bacterium]